MRETIRTALLASADEDLRGKLSFLLAANGISLLDAAADGLSAEKALSESRPDLLIADAHLPLLDGCALAERVYSRCSFRPETLLLCRREFPVPRRAKLEDMGAVFLIWPASAEAFRAALAMLESKSAAMPEARVKRADELLNALGFPEHSGTRALRCAAVLCAQDERLIHRRNQRLYPMVGEMLSLSPQAVERALRYAIGAAWQSSQFENQYRIFADTVDAGRGQPTCGEMIARLADILRLEG